MSKLFAGVVGSLVIFAVVAVVLTTSVLIPVVQSAEDDQRITYNNEGYLADEVGDEAVNLSWDTTGLMIGDVELTPNSAYGGMSILMTDSGLIFANGINSGAGIIVFGDTLSFTPSITAMDININPSTKTVTVSNIVAPSAADSVTFQYSDWALVAASDGDYCTWIPTYGGAKTIHVAEDSPIYATYINGVSWGITVKDGVTTKAVNISDYSLDVEGSANEYDGIIDYEIAPNGAGDYVATASGTTYSPYMIAFDSSVTVLVSEGSNSIISLFAIIPILIIAAVIVAVVRAVVNRE